MQSFWDRLSQRKTRSRGNTNSAPSSAPRKEGKGRRFASSRKRPGLSPASGGGVGGRPGARGYKNPASSKEQASAGGSTGMTVTANNMNHNTGPADTGPIKPAYAPQGKGYTTVGNAKKAKGMAPKKTEKKEPKKYGKKRPSKGMKKARNKGKFDFGGAIRRGFGSL